MHCISVTYRKAPVEVREKFAWSKRQIDQFQNEEQIAGKGCGMVILSTCNRSEVYFTEELSVGEMGELIRQYKNIDEKTYEDYTEEFQGEDAEKHLFSVTSGLDSMVLGEDEVQRQVKDAYQFAHELGNTGRELNMLFQGALRCSRKIKAETDIKFLPVSIGTLTANFAAKFAETLGRPAKTMIIGGAGKIGKVVVKDMLDIGAFDLYCTVRRHKIDLDDEDRSEEITELDYDERYSLVNDCDIIISATSSPHCTIERKEYERNAEPGRERLLIDLAVPRDIDPDVKEIEGVSLYDIDFIKGVSEENNRKKAEEKVHMEKILDEVYAEVKEDMAFSDLLDENKEFIDSIEGLRKKIYKMRADSTIDEIRQLIESEGE